MIDKKYKAEIMRDFIVSPGWKLVAESLEKKVLRALEALAVEDPLNQGKIAYWQAVVRVCRDVASEPKRVIQEGKHETDG